MSARRVPASSKPRSGPHHPRRTWRAVATSSTLHRAYEDGRSAMCSIAPRLTGDRTTRSPDPGRTQRDRRLRRGRRRRVDGPGRRAPTAAALLVRPVVQSFVLYYPRFTYPRFAARFGAGHRKGRAFHRRLETTIIGRMSFARTPARERESMSTDTKPVADESWRTVVAPHMKPRLWPAVFDVGASDVAFLVLLAAMFLAFETSCLLVLANCIPAGGFLVRTFIVFHDCGHG